MALPSSGPISFSDLTAEIGFDPGSVMTLEFAGFILLDYPLGTTVSMSDFYGVSNTEPYPDNINAQQVDLDGVIVNVGWDEPIGLSWTVSSYKIWVKVNSGSWGVRDTVSGSFTNFTDDDTQPGYTHYYRVQAIGPSGETSPPDADMTNSGTTYPPTAEVYTENLNPTTT